jgi:hypothetical protein
MRKLLLVAAFAGIFAGGVAAALAAGATIHGHDLRHDGAAIRLKDFDVTLNGRLLTASDAVYHPETGIVDLNGRVRLHFGKGIRTFPGEVR